MSKKFRCPCCEFLSLSEEPSGTFQICEICYWEDDNIQFNDHNYVGGANEVSLNQARKNFKEFGASKKEYIKFVRKPRDEENP